VLLKNFPNYRVSSGLFPRPIKFIVSARNIAMFAPVKTAGFSLTPKEKT